MLLDPKKQLPPLKWPSKDARAFAAGTEERGADQRTWRCEAVPASKWGPAYHLWHLPRQAVPGGA